jgi:hypothetical protein
MSSEDGLKEGVWQAVVFIVTWRRIVRQRLGKHISAESKARNNSTSIVRQRISKHASLTIEFVFSAWSMQSSYREEFS